MEECIPVVCVPKAAVAATRCQDGGGTYCPLLGETHSLLGADPPWQTPSGRNMDQTESDIITPLNEHGPDRK